MKILHNGIEVLDIQVDDNSYRYRAIKGDHNLTLYFSLAEHIEIPVGAYCVYQNETYTLEKPESLKMKHSRNFEYTVIFESPQAKAQRFKFRNPVDGRLKFSLTAKPIEHLQMFVDNMNQRDSGWSVGHCVDSAEITLSYNHVFCNDALTQMADELETEYEFVGKQVSLGKVEYNKDNPLPLSYGRGNGFEPGAGRSNFENKIPIEILYTQGSDRNIDPSKYGSPELLLPKSQQIRFDGVHFEDEDGFDSSKARIYTTDAQGYSVRRADKQLSSLAEDSLDCSGIYPSRVGTVSEVVVVDADKNFYDIIDSGIPAALNFEDCLIEGETMTVIFQSGMLAGRELEVKYIHEAKGGKSARRFEIVPQEIDGVTMPGGVYIPRVSDKYAVFNCMLPDAYICDNATKSGASWDMFREAVKNLYDNEDPKFSFSGTLDGIWAKRNWDNVGGKIKLGGFVRFSAERFQPEGVLVRIIGIKDYINDPHSPEIELSNSTVGCNVSSQLKQIKSNEVLTEDLHREAMQFTKRRYRHAQETMTMLENAMLDKFTNSISPISIQAMAMLVGDESLQFRFVDSITTPTPVAHNVVYNQSTKVLSAPAGIIQHLTLGIDTISSNHADDEYKYWTMVSFETPPLTDGDKKYYLYAKVSKTAQTGVFYISETAIAMEAVAGYYHLLMGVLNSEFAGERSYASLYGFSEILPGRITTDKIVSTDGSTYFDLSNNIIAGKMRFIAGSSGLTELDEWAGVNSRITTGEASKNLVAKKLGYADWEAMVIAAESGQTIINGGYIRTELLHTINALCERLEAVKRDSANNVVGSLLLTPDGGMQMFDGQNNQLAEYTAEERSDMNIPTQNAIITEVKPDITFSTTSQTSMLQLLHYENTTGDDATVAIPELNLRYKFTYTSAASSLPTNMARTYTIEATVQVLIGSDPLSATVAGSATTGVVTFGPGDCEEVEVGNDLYRYIGRKSPYIDHKLAGTTYTVPADEHIWVMYVLTYVENTYSGAGATSWQFGVRFAGNSLSDANRSVSVAINDGKIVTSVFGNGFVYARSAEHYVAMLITNSLCRFIARNGLNAVQFGVGGLKKSLDGGNTWVPSSPTVLVARMTYNSSGNTVSITALYNPKSLSLSVTRVSQGIYNVSHGLGQVNYAVIATCINSSYPCSATQQTLTASSCTIQTGSNISLSDSSFVLQLIQYS